MNYNEQFYTCEVNSRHLKIDEMKSWNFSSDLKLQLKIKRAMVDRRKQENDELI